LELLTGLTQSQSQSGAASFGSENGTPTKKAVQKNIPFVSIEHAWQVDILTASCALMVHTPDKEILAATIVFCVSWRPGWHRLSAAEVGYRLHGGVAGGTMLGNQGRGDYSSYCRRPRGSYWHFAGYRISNPPRWLLNRVMYRIHLAMHLFAASPGSL
jgi:hypothetical protein